jgi:hypothetical protein
LYTHSYLEKQYDTDTTLASIILNLYEGAFLKSKRRNLIVQDEIVVLFSYFSLERVMKGRTQSSGETKRIWYLFIFPTLNNGKYLKKKTKREERGTRME